MDEHRDLDDHRELIEQLQALGSRPIDPGRQAADLAAMHGVGPARAWRPKLRVAAAFLAGLLVGGTGLASANALPDPAQRVAHSVLGSVGIDVPKPERYHGSECGSEVKRNHGAYVRDNHSLAKSRCGKPVQAGTGDDDGGGNGGAAKDDACRGKPPWAGGGMTAEEKAAAQADRAARCGRDDAGDDDVSDAGDDEPDASADEATTTPTAAATTTTTTEVTTTSSTTATTADTTTSTDATSTST